MNDAKRSLVDSQWVHSATNGNAALIQQLAALITQQTEKLQNLIRENQNPQILIEQLHLMKGSTASLGMRSIAESIATAERFMRSNSCQNPPFPNSETLLRDIWDAISELKSLQ